MRKVGLYLINVNIADITDESDYIESIGKKAASTAVEQARIDVANAERDGAIGKAEADRVREIQVAQNTAEAEKGRKAAQADQRVFVEQQEAMAVGGENAAQAEIARANADLAEAEASAKQRADVATAQAEAEIAKATYDEEEPELILLLLEKMLLKSFMVEMLLGKINYFQIRKLKKLQLILEKLSHTKNG